MFILIVNLRVKQEHIDAFREATIENARNSLKEEGILRFDFLQQTDDPTRFALYEVYRNADAPAKHRETAHFNAWAAKAAEMLAEPRTRTTFGNVFPADQNW